MRKQKLYNKAITVTLFVLVNSTYFVLIFCLIIVFETHSEKSHFTTLRAMKRATLISKINNTNT